MTKRQEFTVRKAVSKDSSGILKCLHEAFEPYRQAYTPEAFADTMLTPQTLERRFSTMSIFVATTSEEQIIGTIACSQLSEGAGHIRGMAVRAAWHGSGVGQKLLEAAESELKSRGFQCVLLDTTAPLQRAIAFYLRNGFEPSGNVKPFFRNAVIRISEEIDRTLTAGGQPTQAVIQTTTNCANRQQCAFLEKVRAIRLAPGRQRKIVQDQVARLFHHGLCNSWRPPCLK